jgi:hypothetical protein
MMCKVATPANANIRRPCVAQNKGWTLIATLTSPISLLRNESEVLWREPCNAGTAVAFLLGFCYQMGHSSKTKCSYVKMK